MSSNEQDPEVFPGDLIATFRECEGYPQDELGVIALAQGLASAAKQTGVSMADIVAKCRGESIFCPASADLLTVAKEIRGERKPVPEAKRDQTAEWRAQYGAPVPWDWQAEAAKIMEDAKEYWKKDRQVLAIIAAKCRERGLDPRKLSYCDRFRMQVAAQRQVGLPVTPEQVRELRAME